MKETGVFFLGNGRNTPSVILPQKRNHLYAIKWCLFKLSICVSFVIVHFQTCLSVCAQERAITQWYSKSLCACCLLDLQIFHIVHARAKRSTQHRAKATLSNLSQFCVFVLSELSCTNFTLFNKFEKKGCRGEGGCSGCPASAEHNVLKESRCCCCCRCHCR